MEGNAYELQQPVRFAGLEQKWIGVRIYNHDVSFAPPGKTVLTSAIYTDHAHWKALEADRNAYEVEKDGVAQAFVLAIEQV